MLKTHCKAVKTKIRKIILDAAETGLPEYGYTAAEIAEKPVTLVNKIFTEAMSCDIVRYGRAEAFTDWLRGLCNALPVYDGVYYNTRKVLEDILEETEEESAKYSDWEVGKLFLYLVYREYEFLLLDEQRKHKEN